DRYNVGKRGSCPSGDAIGGCHVGQIVVARNDVRNVEKIVVGGFRGIGIEPVLVVEVVELEIDLINNSGRVDAGRAAKQLRVIVHQRHQPIPHGLQIGLYGRQVVGVDAAKRLGLGVVEYRSQLCKGGMRRVRVQRRRQFGRREVEPGIVVLDAQGLKHRIVLDGVDDVQ